MKKLNPNPSVADLARLAAFIDGEGCIAIKANTKGGSTVALVIANTDTRLLLWLKETFGVGNVWARRHMKYAKRTLYSWDVTGSNAVELLKSCYEYLIIKREQADIIFAYRALTGKSSPEVKAARTDLKGRLFVIKRAEHPLQEAKGA